MPNVFPENMNKIPIDDTQKALMMLEAYMRYIRERVEFAFNSITKVVNRDGMSTTEVVIELQELQQIIATMQSMISIISGRVSNTETSIVDLGNRLTSIEENVVPISGETAPTTETVGTVGQIYIAGGTDVYVCVSATETEFTWVKLMKEETNGNE